MMNTLMEKPEDKELKIYVKRFFYGEDMEDKIINSIFNEWCRFKFPHGVKEKLEKNKLYKVWYDYKDDSDPMNSSCLYSIIYIEEVPEDIEKAYNDWKINEQKAKDYLFED